MKIYIASDHAGKATKEKVKEILKDLNYGFIDLSPKNSSDDDYPDFAHKVAKHVSEDENAYGFLSCGTGIGISIAANKHEGIRAAKINNEEEAILSRKHNNANVLVIGNNNDFTDSSLRKILERFYSTEFEKGRHLRRVKKIE